jgi:hypothetical protein
VAGVEAREPHRQKLKPAAATHDPMYGFGCASVAPMRFAA